MEHLTIEHDRRVTYVTAIDAYLHQRRTLGAQDMVSTWPPSLGYGFGSSTFEPNEIYQHDGRSYGDRPDGEDGWFSAQRLKRYGPFQVSSRLDDGSRHKLASFERTVVRLQ